MARGAVHGRSSGFCVEGVGQPAEECDQLGHGVVGEQARPAVVDPVGHRTAEAQRLPAVVGEHDELRSGVIRVGEPVDQPLVLQADRGLSHRLLGDAGATGQIADAGALAVDEQHHVGHGRRDVRVAERDAVSELIGEVRPDVPQGSPDERLDAADPGSRVQAVIRMDLGHERQVTCRYSSAGGAREGRPEEELR